VAAARVRAAKPEAEEAMPAPVGKLFSETILAGRVNACQLAQVVEVLGGAEGGGVVGAVQVEGEAVGFVFGGEVDGGGGVGGIEGHGDTAVHGDAEGIVAVAPVFDEGDVGTSHGRGFVVARNCRTHLNLWGVLVGCAAFRGEK
jgi:hypothetical protein